MAATTETLAENLIEATGELRTAIDELNFSAPVACVYNPLDYARESHYQYLRKYGASKKRIVFLGMNPGPWGMVQTGIPFGEISMVRDWLGIQAPVAKPSCEHPKRPILGFDCHRSEVSGKRLWGFFAEQFTTPENFFSEHYVANYCPLAFVEESGRNRTPDKLPGNETAPLYAACDRLFRKTITILQPEWVIGVGAFAEQRAATALEGMNVHLGRIPHPSPANPAANKDWGGMTEARLKELSVWK